MTANTQTVIRPATVDEVATAVREHDRIHVVGAATKTAMAAPCVEAVRCELTQLAGVVEHQPSEFLITALAGTTILELQETLRQHGQYFPFDPPLIDAGATIGGTLAAGLSGPGRLRYGGIRDFIMGVRLVDGLGKIVTAGGRVVKNAAGYDIPKLMVGSCGYLGALVEVTLKVFPQPIDELTLRIKTADFSAALKLQAVLARSPIELTALDLVSTATLLVRISGDTAAVAALAQRIEQLIASNDPAAIVTRCSNADDLWRPLLDGSWLEPGDRLVRVPLAPGAAAELEQSLAESIVPRRYSVAGNLVWIRWPSSRPLGQLDELLRYHRLGGSVLLGQASRYRIGCRGNASMMQRIKQALDPHDKFVGCP
jgi:glycolate oxidase FAD binding subunit